MSQWVAGTGVIRSAPAMMSFQNPVASDDPGKSADTPTTAIGGLGLFGFRLIWAVLARWGAAASGGTATPNVRNCWARVRTAAPSIMLLATWVTVRFSGSARNDPAVHALNA